MPQKGYKQTPEHIANRIKSGWYREGAKWSTACKPGCNCKRHNNPLNKGSKPCKPGCTCGHHNNPNVISRLQSKEMRDLLKELWKNPDHRKRALSGRGGQRQTRIEQTLIFNLENMYGADQCKSEFYIAGYSVDCAVPYLQLAFEADGGYWHQDKESDINRQKFIEDNGWKVIRFSEYELIRWGLLNIPPTFHNRSTKCKPDCICNRHNGNQLGRKHSEETKTKMRESHKIRNSNQISKLKKESGLYS